MKKLIILVFVLFSFCSCNERELTKEEKREKQIKSLFSGDYDKACHLGLVSYVLKSVSNPNDFSHTLTAFIDKDSIIALKMGFSIKNKFGGADNYEIVADSDSLGNIVKVHSFKEL